MLLSLEQLDTSVCNKDRLRVDREMTEVFNFSEVKPQPMLISRCTLRVYARFGVTEVHSRFFGVNEPLTPINH